MAWKRHVERDGASQQSLLETRLFQHACRVDFVGVEGSVVADRIFVELSIDRCFLLHQLRLLRLERLLLRPRILGYLYRILIVLLLEGRLLPQKLLTPSPMSWKSARREQRHATTVDSQCLSVQCHALARCDESAVIHVPAETIGGLLVWHERGVIRATHEFRLLCAARRVPKPSRHEKGISVCGFLA